MIIRTISLIIVFLFTLKSPLFSEDNLINEALDLYNNNQVNQAIDTLLVISDEPLAQYYLGSFYGEGLQDYDNAVVWYESCAKSGDVDCQYFSYFYFYQLHIEKKEINDLDNRQYEECIQQEFSDCRYYSIYTYDEIYQDLENSHYWLEQCTKAGDMYCINDLGHRYDSGIFVGKNQKKAFELFSLASEQGISNAYTSIASYYLDGLVVDQNYNKAFEYYNLGAESDIGNPERAIYGLGLMYEKGLGTKVDYIKAKEMYLKANSLGHELSLVRKDAIEGSAIHSLKLAESYMMGDKIDLGLPIDYEEAAFFFKIAEFKGEGDGATFDKLFSIMDEGGFNREWLKAGERFEIWKVNLGFADPETIDEISQYRISHTGTASYINSNILVTNKHVVHSDNNETNKCDKIVGYDPYNGQYEEYEIYPTKYLPKPLDVDFIYNPKITNFNDINLLMDKPRLGESVFAIGFPQGDYLSKYPKITSGIVSSDFGAYNEPDEFIIDATSYGGSSGSPIYNTHNQLIGILYAGPTFELSNSYEEDVDDPNIAFVVKSSYLNELLKLNGIDIQTKKSSQKFETYEIAEMNVSRVRFIECYVNINK